MILSPKWYRAILKKSIAVGPLSLDPCVHTTLACLSADMILAVICPSFCRLTPCLSPRHPLLQEHASLLLCASQTYPVSTAAFKEALSNLWPQKTKKTKYLNFRPREAREVGDKNQKFRKGVGGRGLAGGGWPLAGPKKQQKRIVSPSHRGG